MQIPPGAYGKEVDTRLQNQRGDKAYDVESEVLYRPMNDVPGGIVGNERTGTLSCTAYLGSVNPPYWGDVETMQTHGCLNLGAFIV